MKLITCKSVQVKLSIDCLFGTHVYHLFYQSRDTSLLLCLLFHTKWRHCTQSDFLSLVQAPMRIWDFPDTHQLSAQHTCRIWLPGKFILETFAYMDLMSITSSNSVNHNVFTSSLWHKSWWQCGLISGMS